VTKRISQNEIDKLYEKWKTPDHVKAHCKAVSDVGVKLASELNKHGYNLDLDLIRGTGLVHDVARIYDAHDLLGYKILSEEGYIDEANIVKVHMRYPKYNSVENLNETDIICLSDIVVIEGKYAGLDARIDYIINKMTEKTPERIKLILLRKEEIRKLMNQITEIIGKTFDGMFLEE